jgi:glycosyltransferase involved in cell wall biosynthesis
VAAAMNLKVVALSKRGGGVAFTSLIVEQLKGLTPTYFTAKDAEETSPFLLNHVPLGIPHKFLSSTWLNFFLRTLPKFTKHITSESVVLFTMPHPLDIFFYFLCKIKKAKVIAIVHDSEAHLGEKWPTKSAITWRVRNADHLIFLSLFTQSQLEIPEGKVHDICNFPMYQLLSKNSEKYVLFAGRMKKYQGLDLMLEAWNLASPHLPEHRLLIAGNTNIELDESANIEIKRGWLPPDTLASLIAHSSALALPYKEASQSGLFMQGASYGVPIVATPVGGLVEQCSSYSGALLSRSLQPQDFADALITAVSMPRNQKFFGKHKDICEVLKVNYFT